MIRLLAVDPGEQFCGWAILKGHEVEHADVFAPDIFVDMVLDDMLPSFTRVVMEEWRVYDGGESTWSTCATAEVIGVVRHYCRRHGVPFYTQPALIKKPGFARMRYKGLAMPALKHVVTSERQHAKDAIVHGHKWWWRLEKGEVDV